MTTADASVQWEQKTTTTTLVDDLKAVVEKHTHAHAQQQQQQQQNGIATICGVIELLSHPDEKRLALLDQCADRLVDGMKASNKTVSPDTTKTAVCHQISTKLDEAIIPHFNSTRLAPIFYLVELVQDVLHLPERTRDEYLKLILNQRALCLPSYQNGNKKHQETKLE